MRLAPVTIAALSPNDVRVLDDLNTARDAIRGADCQAVWNGPALDMVTSALFVSARDLFGSASAALELIDLLDAHQGLDLPQALEILAGGGRV